MNAVTDKRSKPVIVLLWEHGVRAKVALASPASKYKMNGKFEQWGVSSERT
jgi:hypothetical protein